MSDNILKMVRDRNNTVTTQSLTGNRTWILKWP